MSQSETPPDPYVWLEEIDSPQSRTFVEARNAKTLGKLCDAQFERDRDTVLAILDAPDRIPPIHLRGALAYNFWQDARNPKGLWRRTTLSGYRNATPDWETVLDIDGLAAREAEDWVWRGCTALPPDHRRGLVYLSRGGADATVVREFDLEEKRFIADGFGLPEAKTGVSYVDADTLLVSSPLGGDDFSTDSGYARTVRRWQRGTPFTDAPIVFAGERTDMNVHAWHMHSRSRPRSLFARRLGFFTQHVFVDDAAGRRQLDVPDDAYVMVRRDFIAINLRSDWTVAGRTYRTGALLAIGFDDFMAGGRNFVALFEPSERRCLYGFNAAADVMAFTVLDNVRSRIALARFQQGRWQTEWRDDFPDMATVAVAPLQLDDADDPSAPERETFVVSTDNSLMPPSLSLARFGEPAERIKRAPARFEATGLAITQHETISVDGARIPYFQVGRADIALDGRNAVLLTGYGGFQIASLPYYLSGVGKLWLERGGTYVIANIRGGGEFGPAWHKAGMREGKKLAHDDFAAVARDLIARGLTQPARLACQGGSNGGLLVGNMLTRYPELFGAINCAVPLLDMKRYTKLLAGASWIAEYGDPDQPDDWAFMQEMSAYHQVTPDGAYPPIFLNTSTRDDRVHPGHARKMAARLAEQGHPVWYYEAAPGGHAAAADNTQLAFRSALGFAFLRHTIAPEMTTTGRVG